MDLPVVPPVKPMPALGDESLLDTPFADRRARLAELVGPRAGLVHPGVPHPGHGRPGPRPDLVRPFRGRRSRRHRRPSLGAGGSGTTARTPWDAGESRWSAGRDLSFVPLRPELVVEVRYDHMEGPRFRHTTQFVRFRPDRDPLSYTFAQLERPVRSDLSDVLH